jgi:ADP-ribose pyrophosphatase
MDTPIITWSSIISSGKWLELKSLEVTHPGWKHSSYEVVSRNKAKTNGVVSILPITKDSEIIMIEQYRIPVGRMMLELPAWCREPQKHTSFEDVVHQELLEETGYRAEYLTHVAEFASSAGMTDETSHAYIAHNCEKVRDILDLDQHEYITPIRIPLAGLDHFLLAELSKGRLMDAKSLALIWYYRTFVLGKGG